MTKWVERKWVERKRGRGHMDRRVVRVHRAMGKRQCPCGHKRGATSRLLVASYKGPAARRDRHREVERLELYLYVVIAS